MKNISKKLWSLNVGLIAVAAMSAPSAQARFELDASAKLTKVLHHPPQVMNIFKAQKDGLDYAKSAFQPWSGSYWPDIVGNIASHYRDRTKAGSKVSMVLNYGIGKKRFKGDYQDVLKNYNTWDKETLNQKLSPTEKYDLFLGDSKFTLTNSVMDEIDFRATHKLVSVDENGNQVDESSLYEGDGQAFNGDKADEVATANPKRFKWMDKASSNVALWSGICDGWAPASIYLPRPIKPVTVTGALGHTIIFYPDDLKALGSYLFARSNTPYMGTMNYSYGGGRCNQGGRPDRNRGTGMVDDMRCNDLDPAVWHGTLLNRIGKDKMGFVMDIDNNAKVNNHPVYAYKVTYFNPSNGKEGNLKDSIVKLSDLRYDGYAARRNPNGSVGKAESIVGVKSVVTYGNYIWAEDDKNESFDSQYADVAKEVEYKYDLELDASGNIVGGEWGDRSTDRRILSKVKYAAQPDFIWMGAPDALPRSEMSEWTYSGEQKEWNVARPFGNMSWAYDGKVLPSDWINSSSIDVQWSPPVVDNGSNSAEAAKTTLKSAMPLSSIVYYLFDQARSPVQK